MLHCASQSNFTSSAEMKEMGWLRAALMREKSDGAVICPKPRRLGLANHPTPEFPKSLRWHRSHNQEFPESASVAEAIVTIQNCTDCGIPVWKHCPLEKSSSPKLAESQTYRRDPLDHFKLCRVGWNLSNQHYWAAW